MSDIEAAKKRISDLNAQITQRQGQLRHAENDLLVLQAAHHGVKVGDTVRSIGYGHTGKTGKVVGFSRGLGFGSKDVMRPYLAVNLIKANGKTGSASHEFRTWEIVQ